MGNNYIQAYQNLLPAVQQQRLLAILTVNTAAAGITSSQSALESQIQKLVAQLEVPLGSPQIQYRPAAFGSKISSNDYNLTMQELFVDLGALFAQDNNIDSALSVHRNLNVAALADNQAALNTITNDVAVYKIVNNNMNGINSAIFNNFYKNDNTYINPTYATFLDEDTNSITLPQGSVNDALNINGLSMATVTTTNYGGGIKGVLSNNQAGPQNAIDSSPSNFWAEVIMSPQPITQTYNGSTQFGPVIETVISLYRIELINYVRLNPFSRFPLNILAIYYRTSSTGIWINLNVAPQSSVGVMDFYFNDVTVKQLKIVINQPCPSVNTYQIPQSQINNSLLWQQIANDELSIVESSQPNPSYLQDMIDYTPGWQAFSDANTSYQNNIISIGYPDDYVNTGDITPTLFKAATQQITATTDTGAQTLSVQLYNSPATGNDSIVTVRMYEYVYGAYEIDVNKIWYVDTGIYTSPTYASPGTIIHAQLDTVDTTPSGSSIEYQLSTGPGQWFNIIPNGGATTVLGERLIPNPSTFQAPLRFACSGVPTTVYQNGLSLPSPTNLVTDGGFASWINPSGLTYWTHTSNAAVNRVTSPTFSPNQYAAQLSASGTNPTQLYQQYSGYSAFKNKNISLGSWVWCAASGIANVEIIDGVGAGTQSSSHPGDSNWHYLTCTRDLSNSSTELEFLLNVNSSSGVAYFDSASAYSPTSQYYFNPASNAVVLSPASYISAASYTVDYPTASGTAGTGTVNFLGSALTSEQYIYTGKSSDQFLVETPNYPFINYAIINDTSNSIGPSGSPDFAYTNGRWLNTNSPTSPASYGILPGQYYDVLLVTVNGFPAQNMTDYYTGERPALTQYDSNSYPYYNYFQAENNLYFNTPVAGLNFKIIYQFLNNSIQLQATLRNNLASVVTQTPSVESYTIKLRTI